MARDGDSAWAGLRLGSIAGILLITANIGEGTGDRVGITIIIPITVDGMAVIMAGDVLQTEILRDVITEQAVISVRIVA